MEFAIFFRIFDHILMIIFLTSIGFLICLNLIEVSIILLPEARLHFRELHLFVVF